MRSGIYIVFFTGGSGSGSTVLAMDNGRIAGADSAGAKVTGTYAEEAGQLKFSARYEFLQSSQLATSGAVVPPGFSFDINFEVPEATFLTATVRINTPQGPANAKFQYITELP